MPVVTNRKTGVPYTVTNDEFIRIKSSPLLSKLFKYEAVTVPDEVVELQKTIKEEVREPEEPVKRKQTRKNKHVQV